MNIWNGSHPLDPRFISVNIPKEPLVKEHLTTEDLQRLYSSPPDSPFLEANKFIRIRKKWMCPCHVDWNVMKSKPEVSTSKRPIFKLHYKEGDQSKPASDVTANLLCKENDNSNTSSTPEVGGGPAVTEATKRKEIQTKNKVKKMPNVIIQNTPETIQYFEHPKKIPTAIPEHRVQLNFLSSCNTIEDTSLTMNPVLDAKFREFGNQFTTKVAELYKNTSKQIQKGKESSNEKIVETLLETENVKELDLRDYAASMLLFQLDIMSRFMEKHLSSD
ncbi:hypothetical protein BC833DRAFT_621051 [Globomyces pollinis-pini]|nr:hypothetical protein BC833DRAFT_621051 [Globomyces pollinis-pini]